jgi:hypothetical protein
MKNFMAAASPFLTLFCFLTYSYLWYMNHAVQAWHVLPWILIVLITDAEKWVQRKIDAMST